MVLDPTVLQELVERVQASDGPDISLDADIGAALGHEITWGQTRFTMESYPIIKWVAPHPYVGMTEPCPWFTSDLGATVRLIRATLPAFGYRIQTQLGGKHPVCTLHAPPEAPDAAIDDGRSWSRHYEGGGCSECHAILVALLKALIAQAGQSAQTTETSDSRI